MKTVHSTNRLSYCDCGWEGYKSQSAVFGLEDASSPHPFVPFVLHMAFHQEPHTPSCRDRCRSVIAPLPIEMSDASYWVIAGCSYCMRSTGPDDTVRIGRSEMVNEE
jgi:hypothetical protein